MVVLWSRDFSLRLFIWFTFVSSFSSTVAGSWKLDNGLQETYFRKGLECIHSTFYVAVSLEQWQTISSDESIGSVCQLDRNYEREKESKSEREKQR